MGWKVACQYGDQTRWLDNCRKMLSTREAPRRLLVPLAACGSDKNVRSCVSETVPPHMDQYRQWSQVPALQFAAIRMLLHLNGGLLFHAAGLHVLSDPARDSSTTNWTLPTEVAIYTENPFHNNCNLNLLSIG